MTRTAAVLPLAGMRVVIDQRVGARDALASLLETRHARIGDDPAEADYLFVDEWIGETDAVVVRARQAGTRVSCLADVILAESPVAVIGVTGTAGKTSTAARVRTLLEAAGVMCLSGHARAANLWPDADLAETLAAVPQDAIIVAELTSTHLAYMQTSPTVAVVTCLWPDHIELHGSYQAYIAAKRRILEQQKPGDWAVLNADDAACRALQTTGRARRVWFSTTGRVEPGVFIERGELTAVWESDTHRVADAADLAGRPSHLVAACAAALAAGIPAGQLANGVTRPLALPYRFAQLAPVGTVSVIDDTMACTPAKAHAALRRLGDAPVILIMGGDAAGVHASDEERVLLEQACAAAAGQRIVGFGTAASRLAPLVALTRRVDTLGEAVDAAFELAADGDVIVCTPMFPLADRDAFARRVAARRAGSA
jgi:UDP-N-acetylmuramoylalanine--D-glutamate ligase